MHDDGNCVVFIYYDACRGYAVTVIMRTLMVCATTPVSYSISGILIVVIINWIMRTMMGYHRWQVHTPIASGCN